MKKKYVVMYTSNNGHKAILNRFDNKRDAEYQVATFKRSKSFMALGWSKPMVKTEGSVVRKRKKVVRRSSPFYFTRIRI